MAETARDRSDVQRFELSFQKGCSTAPWHRQGTTATLESLQAAPMPIHSIGPTTLLHRPLQDSAVSCAQLRLCSAKPSCNPQPETHGPAQPQPLPLATQLSQILKRTLLKLQYILFLASKYPSVSSYSWLSSAILQPPALNLSVLVFCFIPTEGRKIFRCLRHSFRRATANTVAECQRWCLAGIHAITLFLGRRWGSMFLTVSALIKQHIRSFCLPKKKENRLKQPTQLVWKCNNPKGGPTLPAQTHISLSPDTHHYLVFWSHWYTAVIEVVPLAIHLVLCIGSVCQEKKLQLSTPGKTSR